MQRNCVRVAGILVVLAVYLLPMSVAARWIAVDPKANSYPGVSPYVYSLDNPIKFIDPDGKDVAFHVYQTDRTKMFGHMDMFFQDSKGNWLKYNQGDYGVKITKSDGPVEGSLLLRTTRDQDALITKSALQSKADHESGKLKYDELTNNCKDAAVDVVNNSGAGIELDNPTTTLTPTGWFNDQKKVRVQIKPQPTKGNPAEATAVIIVIPKFEIVKKDPPQPPPEAE